MGLKKRRGKATLRKDTAFSRQRRREDFMKSLDDLLSVLSRQVLIVNTNLIYVCIFMTFLFKTFHFNVRPDTLGKPMTFFKKKIKMNE